MSVETQTEAANVSLWNPNAAANWSLLFSPVFGAWLHAKNWIVLGDEKKAKQSMYWVYGGIAVLILSILLPDQIGKVIGVGYLLAWYFSSAKQQVKHVKQDLNNAYERKGWAKPLGIAIAILLTFILVAGIAATKFDPELQQESALTDVSGVWRANTDGAMVTLKLDGKVKTIDVNGDTFTVVVKSYDYDNKIITMVVDNKPEIIWTLRQIFQNDEKFTLNLTLQDGTQDNLSFVRNL